LSFIVEPSKKVPVVYDVDVAVVGAGAAGIFAALAAAKHEAKTVLIDRFGYLGGNIGPGIIVGGGLIDEAEKTFLPPLMKPRYISADEKPRGLPSILEEFDERIRQLRGNAQPNYLNDSNLASYVALKMAEESGVKLMLSTFAADPIIEGSCVCGVFVETIGGRRAVRARVVIDATGNALIAARAGAPMIRYIQPDPNWHPIIRGDRLRKDYPLWDEVGVWCVFAGVDGRKYNKFREEPRKLSEEDIRWMKDNIKGKGYPADLIPVLRKVWMDGEYKVEHHINRIRIGPPAWKFLPMKFPANFDGLLGIRILAYGEIDSTDGIQMSTLEAEIRKYIFDTTQFFRKYIPGFENAYLLLISPYLGARGGPCVEGDYTLTIEDLRKCQRYNDVMHVYYLETQGCDIPYRILLPKNVDGLLVTGRGASYIRRGHDPLVRARVHLYALGYETGIAAALAVRNNVTPRNINIRELQKILLKEGFYLGDKTRIKELGLVQKTTIENLDRISNPS